jgi:tetratricopeptide (TPR) repeat protein
VLSAKGQQEKALAAFDRAEKEGYALYNLPFQRGLALQALKRPEEALKQFERARDMDPPSPAREITLLQIGRLALQLGRRDEGLGALRQLVKLDPRHREGRYLLGMGYVMSGDPAAALPLLDGLLAESPSGPAYYARALANYGLKRKAEALSDIDNAIRMAPDNPNLREWRSKILAMP